MENFGKTAVFLGGSGGFGELLHGRIWPDWGLKGNYIIYTNLYLLVSTHLSWPPFATRW